VWLEAYRVMTARDVAVDRMELNGFSYIFDNYTMRVAMGEAPASPVEDRLVGAIGRSSAPVSKREGSRLQGWVGPTERYFGKERDKVHFIAHTIGGLVDGVELNVFAKRRDLNRGWSDAGKRYRVMEQHSAAIPALSASAGHCTRTRRARQHLSNTGFCGPTSRGGWKSSTTD
jgi:hypothetical protein